ncbi:Pyridine nucleotide-disulfide oxidoreductase [Globisporangium polare]
MECVARSSRRRASSSWAVVPLAAIAHHFTKNKSVTILEAREKLIAGNNLRDKFHKKLDHSHRVEHIQLLCGGLHPVAELIEPLDAALVAEKGFIKANDQLQLEGAAYSHIFALGDAAPLVDHPSIRTKPDTCF